MYRLLLHTACLIAICSNCLATTPTTNNNSTSNTPNPWDGSNISAGYTNSTGSSTNINMTFGMRFLYTQKRWSNQFDTNFTYASQNHVSSRQQLNFQNQFKKTISRDESHPSYIFLNSGSAFDRFGPYSNQTYTIVGFGKKFVNTDHIEFSTELGPGGKYVHYQNINSTDYFVILNTQADTEIKLSDYGTISQVTSYSLGRYSKLSANIAYTNTIFRNLAIRIAYNLDYYLQVPDTSRRAGSDNNLETQTTISLMYRF